MTSPKSVLLLLGMFAAGLCTGVVGTRIAIRRYVHSAIANPDFARDRTERALGRQLRLDPEQFREVREILERARAELQASRAEVRPRVEAVRDATREQILQVLRPEQRKRFERIRLEALPLWRLP